MIILMGIGFAMGLWIFFNIVAPIIGAITHRLFFGYWGNW